MTRRLDQGQITVGGASDAYDLEVERIFNHMILTSVTGKPSLSKSRWFVRLDETEIIAVEKHILSEVRRRQFRCHIASHWIWPELDRK